ncbi:uncharacterized protein F4822DRAFT_418323 [Hypoxylon trugodes]|uniref:uncharacterized protein n=1 Tax=Hypoxylon trugodes TaxID=326681 RepID=UPI00219FB723|nr:uncharacterized protein F4822DRAFT_418323 [Hypoxylon trugodes]KAI1383998.1 hypothetical protein F4822DRAFT_418323 [Hypoxylon trugodes]
MRIIRKRVIISDYARDIVRTQIYIITRPIKKAYADVKHIFEVEQIRREVELLCIPPSNPLAITSPPSTTTTTTTTLPPTPDTKTKPKTSFLHLPPSIRARIYRLALRTPSIAQVRHDLTFWGPYPTKWPKDQHIRSEAEAPSWALRMTTGLGGTGVNQLVFPPQEGQHVYGAIWPLLCGERRRYLPGWLKPEIVVFATDLLRVCRVVYTEVLDVLYGENTICLFGPEMVRFFVRNASLEGLERVRYVHVALVLETGRQKLALKMREVEDAMRMLRNAFPKLRQLDVEVALTWSQPKNAKRFWDWLRNDVLDQFRGLERFVLKVSVYQPLIVYRYPRHVDYLPEIEPLSSWSDEEYEALKARVTAPIEAAVPA